MLEIIAFRIKEYETTFTKDYAVQGQMIMTQFICTLVLILMSNYVAYVLGRERGLWRGYFEGRAEAYREKGRSEGKTKQERDV